MLTRLLQRGIPLLTGTKSPIFLVLTVTVLALGVSFALKAVCFGLVAERPALRLCYTDIPVLYEARGIARGAFPYLDDFNEYPVLTGLFMWTTGAPASSRWAYFALSAAALGMAACGVSYLLARMHGQRALLWAAAPALVLYTFHNWDVLATFFVVLACWLLEKNRPRWAGAALGISAGFKLYALALLPALALYRLQRGERRSAWQSVAIGAGVFAVANLPIVALDARGWWETFTFLRARAPNPDSIWALAELPITQVNLLSASLLAVSFVATLAWAWKCGSRDRPFHFAAGAGMLVVSILLLWGKVHSPQYALWLLPFFVLIPLHVWWWIAYTLADLIVYVTVFNYGERLFNRPFPLSQGTAVVIRHFVLVGLLAYTAWWMNMRRAVVAGTKASPK